MSVMIVDPVLGEEDIKLLNYLGLLDTVAACSTSPVMCNISCYLDNPEADEECKTIIKNSYKEKLGYLSEKVDVSVLETIDRVSSLSWDDINPVRELEELVQIKSDIESIFSGSHSPYMPPIPASRINSVINNLRTWSKATPADSSTIIYGQPISYWKKRAGLLSASFSMVKSLFSDKATDGYKGTIYKNVMNASNRYKVMLDGVKFLIGKKESGAAPESWRVF